MEDDLIIRSIFVETRKFGRIIYDYSQFGELVESGSSCTVENNKDDCVSIIWIRTLFIK